MLTDNRLLQAIGDGGGRGGGGVASAVHVRLQRDCRGLFQCIYCVRIARDARCAPGIPADSLPQPARQNAIVNSCFIELHCIISVVVLGI